MKAFKIIALLFMTFNCFVIVWIFHRAYWDGSCIVYEPDSAILTIELVLAVLIAAVASFVFIKELISPD